MSRESTLIVLNALVGLWYVILSSGFFLAFAQIRRAIVHDDTGAPRGFPHWWDTWGNRAINAGFLGTSLFLSGCGLHHFHLALEVIPRSVDATQRYHAALSENLWVGDHFLHHLIITGAQVIGAPLLLLAGGLSWLALHQRA